jgi:hypothetical protein
LRISPFRWFKELERDKRRTIGRLDSRFEGMDVDAAGERVEYDPSEASYEGAFVARFMITCGVSLSGTAMRITR